MRETGAPRRRPSPYPRPPERPVRKNRRRYIGGVSALVVAGAVTVGVLGTGSAIADGASDEVVFSGGCGLLDLGVANKSTPDKESMSVDSGKEVTFVNNLDTDAVLKVGKTEYKVADGESESIALSNSSEAMMSPDCAATLVDRSEVTTVEVKPGGGDDDSDDGSGGGSGGGNSGGNGGGSDSGGSGDGSGSGDSDRPGDSPNGGSQPKPGEDSAANGHAGDPTGGSDSDSDASKDKDKDQDKADDESEADLPAGNDSDSDGSTTASGVEPVNQTSSSSGLLAVLAAVCLLGVGVAAVRTALASRAGASA